MPNRSCLIAGGTGLIGQQLVSHDLHDFSLTVLGRNTDKIQRLYGSNVSVLSWHELQASGCNTLRDFDIVVNLTGASVGAGRWTETRKQEILDSRVNATTTLANFCTELGTNAPALYNASAIGIYGLDEQPVANGLGEASTEDSDVSQADKSFLASIGRAWEQATQAASEQGVRVVLLRFGVVLAKQGGALPRMVLPVQLGFGGRIGSGHQAISWVHLQDAGRAVRFLIDHPDSQGPYNIVAPECVQQQQFVKTLAKTLRRPCLIPTPGFVLKLMLGQMADELLLNGKHVRPKRLRELGFEFEYSTLSSALNEIYGK